MPVFHTKTIESILEPVAQQVSRLVILHEEAEDGNAMPDLARPVQMVKLAVDNLVKVGYDTISSSEDQILKQDMPPALNRVEEASIFLLEASDMLRKDPYSPPARKKLIEGSRGILQGTSALLLAFDESEVRKIIRSCKSVLEYLAITEVVETMEDLVTFVKNLSPGLTRMTKEVDSREKELTHQVHREWLRTALEQVKQMTPLLISSIKILITVSQGTQGLREAQNNRDFVVQKMADQIHEIIRVLQLTTYDEEEWGADDLTVMKKAQNALEGKMKHAQDWLADCMALPGSSGERALRQILDDALRIAERCAHPADREAIHKAVSDIQSMADALCELRAAGKGSSPQAIALSRGIQQKLGELQEKCRAAVINTERSGLRKPAPTVAGKLEQAQEWLRDPSQNDKGLGEQATRQMIAEGYRVADRLPPGQRRQELQQLCAECEQLTNELADLVRKGQGHTPAARALAAKLSYKLAQLKAKMQHALLNQVAEDFMDISTPLKQLSDAANAPYGTPNREANFEDKAVKFDKHANRLADTALQVATAGGTNNKRLLEGINTLANQVKDMTPQVLQGARIVLADPSNSTAVEHFNLLKDQWLDGCEKLRGLVDDAMDTVGFIKACEDAILRETERTEKAIRAQDPATIVNATSGIARRANRVLQVAKQEAENSEDPVFVGLVNQAVRHLEGTIAPMVQSAKAVAQNPRDSMAAAQWRGANGQLINAVGGVRLAVTPADYQDPNQVDQIAPDLSHLSLSERAPPRPPLPQDSAPPRPPPPETDDEDESAFPMPQANQPIMMAAHALHMDVKQWSSRDNDIIAAAKRMALLMARLSQLVRGEGGTKKDLIDCAKAIAQASEEVTRLASELARECTDKRMRTNLLQVCERIPTIGTQLKILSTVKATMLGAQGSEEDQEATEMLVGNAQNLMQSVRETVRAAEAASIKIRVDSGYTIRWLRKRPWYS